LRQRGVHSVFHSSLLRIHIPNDDCLFPGRTDTQIVDLDSQEPEWIVDTILSHKGSGENATFEVRWCAGDVTWLAYHQVSHLGTLAEYLDLIGVWHSKIARRAWNTSS
ncbi:hypothetical protein K503DRAFT_701539, partial [Rhizopogon vinicolor AM-OR11-026]